MILIKATLSLAFWLVGVYPHANEQAISEINDEGLFLRHR